MDSFFNPCRSRFPLLDYFSVIDIKSKIKFSFSYNLGYISFSAEFSKLRICALASMIINSIEFLNKETS